MRALLDTNVIYPTVMRDLLLGVASSGLFFPLWSPRILDEWRHVASRKGTEDAIIAETAIQSMMLRFPESCVKPKPSDETRLSLPDESDVHVLAAAIAGSADVIVTQNRADFPRGTLFAEGLERTDADSFLWRLWSEDPNTVSHVAEKVRTEAERLSGEPWPMQRLLKKARLPRLARALSR